MNYLSIPDFCERFPNEEATRQYIADRRWNGEPVCPRCGSTKVWEIKGGMHYKCGDCSNSKAKFSVRTGTIMENSRTSLQKWLLAIYLMCTVRTEFSKAKFAKHLGVTQKTAWRMEHRIRRACEGETTTLSGEIEVDETYIGGKETNKDASKRPNARRGTSGKAAVVGLQERRGAVVAMCVDRTDKAALQPIVEETEVQGSTVSNDESRACIHLKHAFDHSAGEYVRQRSSTNSVESFWALIKRGYCGKRQWWSIRHLHSYVAECVFRQNTRHLDGLDAIGALTQASQGKHLIYANLIKQ